MPLTTGAVPRWSARILIAEDDASVRRLVTSYLARGGARVVPAANAREASACLEREPFDLLITDVNMPGPSGIRLLEEVKAHWPALSVVIMTGSVAPETVVEALHGGADRYLMKPFSLAELGQCVDEALARTDARRRQEQEHAELVERVRTQEAEVRSLVLRAAHSLVQAVEAKDAYTAGHSLRVTEYGLILADEIGGFDLDRFRIGAELHDIGKIGVPDVVLNKPAALEPDEMAKIREHPVVGRRILEPLIQEEQILSMTLSHHERWDGRGYPEGLAGAAIPPAARILAVADTLDAMTSSRAYRPARPWEEAVAEIRRQSGGQFDPQIVEVLESALGRLQSRYLELHSGVRAVVPAAT